MEREIKTFVSPIKIITGTGSLSRLPEEIAALGVSKTMIFADPGVLKAGILDSLTRILDEGKVDYTIYSDIQPEPPIPVGDKAVAALRDSQAELVIGIGGGSCLDITKAAAVLSKHDGSIADYLNLTGKKKLSGKGLPKILIPTTSGTGAEVTDIAVFSLESTKDVLTHPYLLADIAIVDPELTYSLPPKITAATGVDALTHAAEAFFSVNASPITDTLALEAIRKISSNIHTAVLHGSDKSARREMSYGSLLAGLSFYNAGVAGVHALAYPLGGLFKISHGESNALLLPYVFDFIWPACSHEKMLMMTEALGVPSSGLTKRKAALTAVTSFREMIREIGLSLSLQDFGIRREDIERLSQDAIKQTRLLARSPMPYTLDDIRRIYINAWEGKPGHEY
ncbi:iron-containing alcohol dehydrogenase [Paenibacillus contaminans]|uniref:Alcohol dehydrogenase n=1 Tax=Paenibacillus contaminans TaxID=450362 RepID=A0A329MSR2_9BACL|nr:iron-containing alcohol dehydrogenase [Paenibacillus contaminans]RAV23019.1 alcohol dehydrogenase [Paenibacillus contaminans]